MPHALRHLFTSAALVAFMALGSTLTASAQSADDPARRALIARATEMAIAIQHDDYRQRLLLAFMHSLPRAGAQTEAEALARSQPDPAVRARMLTELAGSAAGTGDVTLATRLANEVAGQLDSTGDPVAHAPLRAALATVFAQIGASDRALNMALAIPGAEARVETLNDMAPYLADPDRFRAALAALLQLRDDPTLTAPLSVDGFVMSLVQAGQVDAAIDLLGPPGNSEPSLNTVTALAEALIERGQTDAALDLRQRLGTAYLRDIATLRLLPALAEAGEGDRAAQLAEGIIAEMETTEITVDTIARLLWLVDVLPHLGLEAAMDGLQAIAVLSTDMKHAGLLADIAAEMDLLGRERLALATFSTALRLAAESDTLALQSQALVTISRGLRRAGRDITADEFLANALSLAQQSRHPLGDGSSLVYIARAQFQAGRPSEALATLSAALTAAEQYTSLGQFVILRDALQALADAT